MRYNKAKNFTFQGKPCVKVGQVEMYEADLIKNVFEDHKPFIVVRTHAYHVDGKACQKDDQGRTVYNYHKVKTVDTQNTLPHRYFFRSYEEMQGYIAA